MSRIFFVCCLVLSFVSPALAIESDIYPYVGVTVGSPLITDSTLSDSSGSLGTDFDPGYLAGVSAGVAFNTYMAGNVDRIRIEAEFGYRTSDLTKIRNLQGQSADTDGALTLKTIMLNGYLDNTSLRAGDLPITIFLTAGAGAALASLNSVNYKGVTIAGPANDTQFAYLGGFGIGCALTKNITLDATYKYLGTVPFQFDGIKADYASHNILLGAWYAFK